MALHGRDALARLSHGDAYFIITGCKQAGRYRKRVAELYLKHVKLAIDQLRAPLSDLEPGDCSQESVRVRMERGIQWVAKFMPKFAESVPIRWQFPEYAADGDDDLATKAAAFRKSISIFQLVLRGQYSGIHYLCRGKKPE